MGKKMAENVGKEVLWLDGDKSIEERTQAMVKLLNSLGQKAKISKVPEGLCVVSHNCVFRSAAVKHPSLYCDIFHKSLFDRLLSPAKVQMKETIAKGDRRCVMIIPASKGDSQSSQASGSA
jgi:predicted ArsR family transcriptional regulator